MKITDPEVIKNGEKDLIESVQEDLDPETVREILKERLAVAALSSRGGQIVVHDNAIAFRLDFEVNLSGSLLFDRDGNLIEDQAQDLPAPDMDLDEDLADNLADNLAGLEEIAPDQNLSAEPEDGLEAPETDDLTIDLPEYDLNEDEPGEGQDEEESTDAPSNDIDDDINDILKESREFWEQKED